MAHPEASDPLEPARLPRLGVATATTGEAATPLVADAPATERLPEATKPAVTIDPKVLADAANEAAKREGTQWFFFVTIMITLAALVGSTTHRVLFLEDPVKVPILSVELPLLGFYVAAPGIFLVLHFYLLAQMKMIAGKVNAFLDAAEREAKAGGTPLSATVPRLDSFPVVQLLAAQRLRTGRALALRLMVWVTLAVGPVLLLLFQI